MAGDEPLGALQTERRSPALADLDTRPTVDVVRALVRGRVVYVAAGSGGHLARVDAAEWNPTFSEDRVVALVAGTDWGAIKAASVIYTLPVAIDFILLRKYLMKGTTAGAVKG